MYSFPNLKPVCCSMSGSNCCFLTCIQISQEAGQVVWCSHLFMNFPQFIVIHTVKDLGFPMVVLNLYSSIPSTIFFIFFKKVWTILILSSLLLYAILKIFLKFEVWLIYSVSGVQQSDSVMHIIICALN